MFDARALDRRYAFLDDLPAHLLPDVVTLPLDGPLEQRIAGVRRWRDALLAGTLPPPDTWPPPEIAAPARRALADMDLARFCRDQPELVDALLADVLAAWARRGETFASEVAAQLAELAALERRRADAAEGERAKRERRPARPVAVDEAALREAAARAVRERAVEADPDLLAAWGERARLWSEIADVFGDLGEMLGRGWDLSRGVLRQTGWTDLLRLRALVEQLPQLRDIVRALGRLHARDDGESIADRLLVPVRRLEEERREVRTPLAPTETRGVERSGEVARMLPLEAALLGHPRLRLLWHARRAERTLLTYRFEGLVAERVLVEREAHDETEGRRPRPERGPIVAIVDTSGSMHGLPERVAKAIVLEALRTAHAERRRCFLYAYSGPGEVLEHALDVSPEGVGRLLQFLAFSFGGGNDEAGVLRRVLARLEAPDWRRADVLFVSDGEWPVPPGLVEPVARARDAGARFHGVQIGNRGPTGLHALCDPVHVFEDWATAGGWR